MSKKTLLVLAASRYQIDVIQTARRLGYRVITTDNRPDNPGHQLADKAFEIDVTDREAVLDLARRERIDGIIAACTDVGVPTAAYVANRCGLSGPPWPECRQLTDKIAFRELIEARALPSPDYVVLGSSNLRSLPLLPEGRWIIKPECGSGSKGVFIVESQASLGQRLAESLAFSPTGRCVVERYLEGHQGTCEGLLKDGVIVVQQFTDRQTVQPPFVTTCGHRIPTTLASSLQNKVCRFLSDLFSHLGVTDGPFDCDFVASGDEIYLLEASPRIGGNCMARLLHAGLGLDLIEYSVRLAIGEDVALPELPLVPQPCAAVLFGTERAGRLEYDQEGADWLGSQSWVKHMSFDKPLGSDVRAFVNGRERVGEALLTAKTRIELDERVIELRRVLAMRAG